MGLFGKKKTKEEPKKVEKETSTKTSTTKATTQPKPDKPVKKEEPVKAEEPKKTGKKPIYRVLYDKEARVWVIKKDGAKRTIASYVTKEEALNRVKELSASNDLNFIVHKKDGKFQKK